MRESTSAPASASLFRSWKQTISVAGAFWGACLLFVAIEVTVGSNVFVNGLFFLSIPLLVSFLAWANLGLVRGRTRSLSAVFMLGLTVLISASVIILVGLAAAVGLERILTAE